ncbi:MAG: M61 family metallopeptidase [Acidobacteria bacterium]|nr:M61 family metallopeptidase [Acidobacteriota bacterium]
MNLMLKTILGPVRSFALASAGVWFFLLGAASAQQSRPTLLEVDATRAAMGVLHAHMVFPVSPGPMTIAYPKWIPGEHAPTGPINQVIRLVFTAAEKQLPWQRDELDPFLFHLNVPRGTDTLQADLDFACEIGVEGFTAAVCSSQNQLVLNWNLVALYSPAVSIDQNMYAARLRLPTGWQYGTPLPVQQQDGAVIQFKPTSLKTLVDSPVIAGKHYLTFSLGGEHPAQMDIIAEDEQALQPSAEQKAHFVNLVAEAEALFRGSRYGLYHMQLSLGDQIDHYTLEHFEASENRLPNHGLSDARILITSGNLIPHEYVHSWNGKYRPPVGLDNPTYLDAVHGKLLWVYEGLTDYLGNVLAARSGIWTPEQFRASLAIDAASMATHTGRTWRSLEDTTTGAQLLYGAPQAWSAARRATDFYAESGLIWLDADTLIRERTRGHRSLDDFCRLFFSPQNGRKPQPYTFDDVVAAMNQITNFDWRNFFRTRLDSTTPQPPYAGVERSGWKVSYGEEKPPLITDLQATRKPDVLWPLWLKHDFTDLQYSLGLMLADDGSVMDVVPDMSAYRGGIAPGMQVVIVNGLKFSIEQMEAAVEKSRAGPAPELVVANGAYTFRVQLDYRGGARYPYLERDSSRPDMLSEILAPHR